MRKLCHCSLLYIKFDRQSETVTKFIIQNAFEYFGMQVAYSDIFAELYY